MGSTIPQSVRIHLLGWLGEQVKILPVDGMGGSHSPVFRVTTPHQAWALKGYDYPETRLAEIHRFQGYLSATLPALVPDLHEWTTGKTMFEAGSWRWELSRWMSGQPVEGLGAISDLQLCAGMQAVGLLHSASHRWEVQPRCPPAVNDRIEMLGRAIQGGWERAWQMCAIGWPSHGSLEALRPWGRALERDGPWLLQLARERWTRPKACFWIVRDLWRRHVLFEGQSVHGIIDYGAARVDWPALDLSRLLGSWLQPNDPRWSLALSEYASVFPLAEPPDVPSLLRLDYLTLLVSGYHWLGWMANRTCREPAVPFAEQRIAELAHRLSIHPYGWHNR
jgi:Ser/Thr protein kinase RdoA (MazF antagonist)